MIFLIMLLKYPGIRNGSLDDSNCSCPMFPAAEK